MNKDTPKTNRFYASFADGECIPNQDEWLALCESLESELTAVTEQRDVMEKKLRIELRGHPDSELWGEAGLIAATLRCVDALDNVTEQRDQWKEKYIQQNKDLGHELRDPNGTIWSECKRLQTQLTAAQEEIEMLNIRYGAAAMHHDNNMGEVMDQRDRLAEALQSVKCELGVPQPEYPSPVANAYWIADQALQSLTPDQP